MEKNYYRGSMFAAPGEIGRLFGYCDFEGKFDIDANFAIIDLETSGLSADTSRVLEIAILKVDSQGEILGSFETLVNPENGIVGRSDIHQITLEMLNGAPTFADMVEELVNFLDNSIIVAHNAKFEENFLSSEFARVGFPLPKMPAVDTMWLAQMKLNLLNYKLDTVARHFGVSIKDAHTAMGDIMAMQEFFPELLAMCPTIKYPVPLAPLKRSTNSVKTVTRGN